MTQLTIAQWLSQSIQTRYKVVTSKRFYGHYDVLDVITGEREPCGNLRTARATCKEYNTNK